MAAEGDTEGSEMVAGLETAVAGLPASDNEVLDDAGDPGMGVSVISVIEDEETVELVCEAQITPEEVIEEDNVERSTSSPGSSFEASSPSSLIPIVISSWGTGSDTSITAGSTVAG